MAILSKKNKADGPSGGHDYPRINDKLYGGGKWKVNKSKELFSSDYVYYYNESPDTIVDKEIGINKQYIMFHDDEWVDGKKNADFARERYYNSPFFDD